MMAEVLLYFQPKLISIHNYPPAHNYKSKFTNWMTLNRKAFKHIGF